jgi:hypothetical protein
MGDYYTVMVKAVGALDPNTGDARRRLYERARATLLIELRGDDPALDQSDIMAAQMALELAIGEVEADAQCQTMGRLDLRAARDQGTIVRRREATETEQPAA